MRKKKNNSAVTRHFFLKKQLEKALCRILQLRTHGHIHKWTYVHLKKKFSWETGGGFSLQEHSLGSTLHWRQWKKQDGLYDLKSPENTQELTSWWEPPRLIFRWTYATREESRYQTPKPCVPSCHEDQELTVGLLFLGHEKQCPWWKSGRAYWRPCRESWYS